MKGFPNVHSLCTIAHQLICAVVIPATGDPKT